MPKTCLFCGGFGPFNEEHFFGRWIWKHLFKEDEAGEIVQGYRNEQGDIIQRKKPYNKDMNVWTRAICVQCNGGWMKRLEDLSGPLIAQMINPSRPIEFHPKGQNLLARWAIKTAMAADSASPPEKRLVSPDLPRALCLMHGRPDALTWIWLGRCMETHKGFHWQRGLLPLVRPEMERSPKGFSSLFGFGQALFQVLRLNEQNDQPLALRTASALPFVQIWPLTDRAIWPPIEVFTRESTQWLGENIDWLGWGQE